MADVTAPGGPAQRLVQAVKQGQESEVQLLVESDPALAGARDVSGVSAILLALYHGHPEIAGWLAARRSDLDIFEAAALGEGARVEALLSAEPSLVGAWSPDGFTALGLASFFGRLAAVRQLLGRGADVNAIGRNPGRYTPLTGAVTSGAADVVDELLRHGADANYRYGPGYTPLHSAAASGSEAIVRLLVGAGADADARTDDGRRPLDFAREKGHTRVVEFLEMRQAP
jgi:uncharacterized protein